MKLIVERFDESVVTGDPVVQVTDDHDGTTVTFAAEEYASLTGWELMQKVRWERTAMELEFAETQFDEVAA